MAYYNAQTNPPIHPLDSSGIEVIDLSHSKNPNKSYFFLNTDHDGIDEINLSKPDRLQNNRTPPPIPPKPNVPERPHRKSPKPETSPAHDLINGFKPKANKRIAPRILPKIPDQFLEPLNKDDYATKSVDNTRSMPPRQDSSETEQNFFIQIDNVGWFYKKDQVNQDSSGAFKSQSSLPAHLDEYTSGDEKIQNSQNSGQSSGNLESTANASKETNQVSNKKWNLFGKIDSTNLELKYRALLNEKSGEPKLVQVLDNLYEVNLTTKKCYAIYWKGRRTFSVMRSVWFQENGEPFEEKSSDEIDHKHLELYKDLISRSIETDSSINSEMEQIRADASSPTDEMKGKNGDAPKALIEPAGSVNLEEGIVTWYSKDEVYWEKNKMSLIEKMNFGFSKFRNKFNGMRIKRGMKQKYRDTEPAEEKEQEITHLVFVVHGIAQKMYENGIVKNCEDLRKECDKKMKEYYPTHKHLRYMFLPVDWRSSLTLDDGIVDTITPNSIQLIREKLNSSALDIMYYTSPLFRIEILNSLSSELNRLYSIFCEKNPYFKEKYSKVSFVAHSLGTVIVYDILTSDNSLTQFSNTYAQVTNQEREKFQRYSQNDTSLLNEYLNCKSRIQEIENNLVRSNNNVTPLGFHTENFFSLGSPLAVFLAMRGVRPIGTGTQEHILPKHLCKNLYNIFHPSDPIAYRIEPLIIKHYTTKSPLEIQKADAPPKVSYKELNEKRSAINLSTDSQKSSSSRSVKNRKDKELEESIGYNSSGVSIPGYSTSPLIEQVELENALDFQLQDSNFELMATLRAHTCYWKSTDTALFILNQLITNDQKL